MNTISKHEAMEMLEKINQSNNNKRPYVRVGERGRIEFSIDGTEWKIISYVNVYSKTWSRRVAKLVIDGVQYGTREARKYLK